MGTLFYQGLCSVEDMDGNPEMNAACRLKGPFLSRPNVVYVKASWQGTRVCIVYTLLFI